ncbi:MAG: hypothetical protein HY861_00855 [Chlamydiia bacterium]|nr:hypothetical protein [Chlamydiia bacterium]
MKITPSILSIPPYISTTWRNISALLSVEEEGRFRLILSLHGGQKVEIPNLDKATVTAILEAHASFADPREISQQTPPTLPTNLVNFNLPFVQEHGDTLDSAAVLLQHNPSQVHFPQLPPSVLKKIAAIAKAFGPEYLTALEKPQPHCNCVYCQVMHAVQTEGLAPEEEEISAKDLAFRDWDVEQTADKVYTVKNPLDTNEHYSVFLGEPLGCTCGHKHCEHIRAVLNT